MRTLEKVIAGIEASPVFSPLGPGVLRVAQFALGLRQREVVNLGQPFRAAAAARIREIVTGFPSPTVAVDEAYAIRSAVLATARVPGALAELGVFRGTTARVICEAKGDRTLHLFDTFAGLPEPEAIDQAFSRGEYACSLDAVKGYLADCKQVCFHEGLFPATAAPLSDERFSFVHLDADLYQSTLDGLGFFYPRLNPGGMIISHDYVEFPPVRHAFDDYFAGIAQPVLELTGNQCLVVKVSA